MRTTLGWAAVLFSLFCGAQAFGQALKWDASGNGLLNGTYYFREVAWAASASSGGAASDGIAMYGNIAFDGAGNYTINALSYQYSSFSINPVSSQGTYSISASGFGFLADPVLTNTEIRGMVSNGVFIGTSTESGYNNFFVAALIPSPAPTLATFNGSYSMAYVTYPPSNGTPNPYYGYYSNPAPPQDSFEDAQFTLNPNGAGNLGTVSIRGYFSGNGGQVAGQQNSGVKYIASGGAEKLIFPTDSSATLVFGDQYLYFSPDGNFVFGGSPQGFDFFVGVKTSGGAPPVMSSPLYYAAGFYSDSNQISSGSLDLDSYYGSFSVTGGAVINHSRIFSLFQGTYNSISTSSVPTTAGATYTDPAGLDNFTIGNGGNVRIGFGQPPYLGIEVALAAPTFSGSGVYLNPTGVVNAASYAPFTAGLSPGELIVLTGTGLASGNLQVATSSTFPTLINGVQVLIDNIPAPLYYVSPTQIAAIVPYEVGLYSSSLATVQVVNNGANSNVVSEFLNLTTPGIFTNPADGIGLAAALHADYSLITEASPALGGENISVYLTGLGMVSPPVTDGAPGSSTTLNNATQTIAADIGGTTAKVLYSGLAPVYAGLYQLNITVPTGLTAGDNFLNISGPDAYSSEAIIPIGSGSAAVTAARAKEQNGQGQNSGQHWKPRPSQKSVVHQPVQP